MNLRTIAGTLALMSILGGPARSQEESWPDLSSPARAVGGGENDAAVVVGIEDYLRVPGVPGAKSNAKQWYQYLTETRGVPAQNVKFLTNDDATREDILEASRKAAGRAGEKGTLWFVFVGHGAPSPDGKDGLLVGVDAQQKATSLEARSLRRQELLKALGKSQARSIVVLLDACFSGRGQDGGAIVAGLQPLVTVAAPGAVDPRMVVLTAAKGNQFAGALPGVSRPAFSYLVLGGLRGWAAGGKKAAVTAGDLWRYSTNALEATLRGRDQTPDMMGKEDSVIGVSAGENGPSLAKLALATAGASSPASKIAPPAKAAQAKTAPAAGAAPDIFKVLFATTKGDVVIEVHRAWAPIGADRFHRLVEAGYYDDTAFFRVISGFMAQIGINGDPAVDEKWKDARIDDDPNVGQSNKPGFVTFAKTGAPNSRTTQFFVNYSDNNFLDGQGFTPFGRVTEGMSVLGRLYSEYGGTLDQGKIHSMGNGYLKSSFPKLDYVKTARIVP